MNKITLPSFDITKKLGQLVLILAIVLVFLVDYFFVIRFQVRAVSSLGRKVSTFTKDIKETHANFKRMDLLKNEAVMLQEKLGKIEKGILPTADMTVIVDHLLGLADRHQVRVTRISPVEKTEAKAFKNNQGEYLGLPIAVEAEGTYHDIGLFFNNIEGGEVCMSIQDFQISRNPQSTKKHLLKMVVTVFILGGEQE